VYVAVYLDAEPATVVLAEAGDCRRFHVAVRGAGGAAGLDDALRAHDAGTVDGDGEALVRVVAVRRLAGALGAAWETEFAAMLDYARTKGWLSEDGEAIRAHVEWE
jgi:hypothetical protein